MFKPNDNDFENEEPTSKEPINPGPLVYAIAFNWFLSIFASESAWFTTGIIFCWCALDASSGTTPPKDLCISWLAIKFDKTLPSHITDAEVSSQEDSIPSM